MWCIGLSFDIQLVVRGKDHPEIISLYITADCTTSVLFRVPDATAVQNVMKKHEPAHFNKQHKVLSKEARKLQECGADTGDNRQGVPHYAMGDRKWMDFQTRFASGQQL
jgi:hypothetical protein